MEREKLIEIFLEEGEGLVWELEECLVGLEMQPGDTTLIDRIFRAAHSLKGSAGLVGLTAMVEVTHDMEAVLEELRDNKISVSAELITSLLQCTNVVKRLLGHANDTHNYELTDDDRKPLIGLSEYLRRNNRLRTKPEPARVIPVPSQQNNRVSLPRSFRIEMRFREDILETGQDPFLLIDELVELCESVSSKVDASRLPPFSELDVYKTYLSWELLVKTDQSISSLHNIFIFVSDDNYIKIEQIDEEKINSETVANEDKCIGQLLVDHGHVTQQDVDEALKKQKRTGELLVEAGKVDRKVVDQLLHRQKRSREYKQSAVLRVRSDKLDNLVDAVGELVISVAQIRQMIDDSSFDKDSKLSASEALEQISRDLHEKVMAIRMVPIEGTFNRFIPMVRDLSQELNKPVQLVTRGGETELDKVIIEKLADPLKHLLRNAIDHGIETEQERAQLGKTEGATVTLSAYQTEGHFYVEVEDNGRGIDAQKVARRAREKGMIGSTTEVDQRLIESLLFSPGFSTAAQVDEISGRGVGLDVVKQNLAELRGTVSVQSEIGVGTCFQIKLPLTLAIIEGMKVKIGSEIITLPLLSIVEHLKPTGDDIKTVEGRGELFRFRGDYLPLVRLHRIFNIEAVFTDPRQAFIVVLENNRRHLGVLVDEVIGEDQVVIKSLDKNFKKVSGIAGATVLGDGTISLIVDIPAIEKMAFEKRGSDAEHVGPILAQGR